MFGSAVRRWASTLMNPFASSFDFRLFEAQVAAVGAAADRDQHAVEVCFGSTPSPSSSAVIPAFAGGEFGDLRVEMDRGERLVQPRLERPDQIAVGSRQQAGRHFDDGHLRTQGRVNRSHLEADVAAADDQQTRRNVGQVEGPGGIHHARIADREDRRHHGGRTGRDDRLAEGELSRVLPSGFLSSSVFESRKRARAWISFTPRSLAQLGHAAGQLADHRRFERPEPIEIDLRLREGEAPLRGVFGLVDQGLATCSRAFDGMQPRCRQTPPGMASSLTSVTSIPRSAASKAAG